MICTNASDNGQFKRWPMSQGHILYIKKLLSQKMLICNVYYFVMNNVYSYENVKCQGQNVGLHGKNTHVKC